MDTPGPCSPLGLVCAGIGTRLQLGQLELFPEMLELETLKVEVFSVPRGIELGKGEAWELLWPSLPLYRKGQ